MSVLIVALFSDEINSLIFITFVFEFRVKQQFKRVKVSIEVRARAISMAITTAVMTAFRLALSTALSLITVLTDILYRHLSSTIHRFLERILLLD